MKNFKLVNRISGWLVFLIASTVYLLTIEPTTGFWDCGEFIASAFKLQVGHPPGAPLFMILARFFSLFAIDNMHVAEMINSMSALASSFTILFLFWTITHLAKKLYSKNDELSTGNMIAIIGSGVVGALAYTFSDTFWFSADEGVVYALSSLFTAIVFWAILKWENVADKKYANRWLILIAYLMGLSIGVHLLNLLAIPAIVFVFYFKKFETSKKGVFYAITISIITIAFIMYGIIPGVVKIASKFELLFVNGFGLPYNSGNLFYSAALIAAIIFGIYYTHKKKKVILNTIILAFTVIVIGYSSFTMIVLRSIANPPMDENNPETVFSLVNYLNREQYGSRPLVKGQYYNAPVVDSKEPYTYRKKNGEYIKQFSLNPIYKYDKRFTTVLPRMYSPNPEHIKEYKKWGSIKGRKITITGQDGKPQIKYIPTFGENIKFFFRYQVNHMYLRYFWWNFAGKQNDIQGHGGSLHGNWLSGFDFYDNMRLGPQENQPEQYKNHKARNIYYMLPFLLGLIGFFFQYNKNKKDFWVVTMLFVLTGLAIVVYLNQTPMQPRERDYAYAGSFYAFAIWIGLGVMGIANLLSKKLPKVAAASLSTIVCLVFVPGIMASENWDDHDRSDRYTARDYAYNYLNSCAPNAILFTHGDNDTFPLWYAQEVEGIRTDVRVVNLSLLNTGWYIDQMKRKAYDSEPVPFSMEHEQYLQGKRDQVYIFDRIEDYVNLRKIIDFVADDDDRTKIKISTSEMINYIPTKKFILSVDSTTVVNNGTVKLKNADKIVPEIKWEINKRRVLKSELMILDLLATNNWERPVYFVSAGGDSNMGLDNYLQLEGFAYRLVPIKTESNDYLNIGGIDADIMYNNLMNKFQWGNMNDTNIYVDHTLSRTTSVIRIRNKFSRLANKLLENGEKDKAVAVLDKCVELMPNKNFPYDLFVLNIIESYYKAGANDKANKIVKKFASISEHDMNYYFALEEPFASSLDYEKRVSAHIMQRLIDVTQRYKQAELSKEIEQSFNNAIRFM
ncbi:MAG: DUF2723 domain-containing protein [Bacteroidales bacterium]|jgi:tetratricopeptide (TPR) repeat protein|nr:DUF2723 domain-containing protein [Bacteroidales bacterium]